MSIRARQVAATVIQRVIDDGAFSQHALASAFERADLDERDRGWVTRAVYATLADLRAVDMALDRLLDRGIDSIDPDLRAHLRLAVWEIGRSPTTNDPAPLVSAAVEAVKRAKASRNAARSAGLANGVLRSLVRDRDKVFNPPKKAGDIERFAIDNGLPDWIATRLVDRLGLEQAGEAMKAFNGSSPVGFRVRTGDRDAVVTALCDEGLQAEAHPWAPDAGLCRRGNLAATALHASGAIVIQDPGAQLACAALPPSLEAGARVLDATAGQGGKTLALAERYGVEAVVATDVNRSKLDRLRALPGLDAIATAQWAIDTAPAPALVRDAAPYAIVVLDAPCTALGTLGRHPEVRINRDASAVDALASLQATLIDRCVELLSVGGVLLYVVCTWTHEETRGQIDQAIARNAARGIRLSVEAPSAENADPRVAWSSLVDDSGAVPLWPHTTDTDGFTIARLRREA